MQNAMRILITTVGIIFVLIISFLSLVPEDNANSDLMAVWRRLGKVNSLSAGLERLPASRDSLQQINDLPLRDNKNVYQDDKPGSVVVMYLTVRQGTPSDNTNHTWDEVNSSVRYMLDIEQKASLPSVDAILQVGDETGPLPGEVGYGDVTPNSVVSVRGNASSLGAQKSFKVKINKGRKGIGWRNQRTIALNKNPTDTFRADDKLSLDLMKELPDLVSLRTQYVHLYVKDETIKPVQTTFVDYGLFTQVEDPDKRFLKNHALDTYASLYKAEDFQFYRYPDQIRTTEDPKYDPIAFAKILSAKNRGDHSKLIRMLDDVNNLDIPITQTFDRFFNSDNYFTWMAFNILVGNTDTDYKKFYLYNPQNAEKFYFLPWNYDGSFSRMDPLFHNVIAPWKQGVSNYWDVVLHRRVLMEPQYRQQLDQKIKLLLTILTPEKIKSLLDSYFPVTHEFIHQVPDIAHLPVSLDYADARYGQIPDEIQNNYRLYQESLTKPMPFYLGTPQLSGSQLVFNWDQSYDMAGKGITYQFLLATDWNFINLIEKHTVTGTTQITIPRPNPGTYYWQVKAINADGKEQVAFDSFIDNNKVSHYGLKYLYITQDKQILENSEVK